ncbi:MAG: asparagine synthetase [Thermoplasmatales archaeon]|nr:asparagine synthetase [Thermoplasmatales archaeon]
MLQETLELKSFLKDEKLKFGVKVGSIIRYKLSEFLNNRGFLEIPPVIISPFTDPLSYSTFDASIECYGNKYYLTKSMIFHKQIAIISFDKIFCFSPNVRLENEEKAKSMRHLFEFTQLDIEVRNGEREEMIKFAEEMLIYILKEVKKICKDEIEKFGREIKIPSIPFKRISFEEAYSKYGKNYEEILSKETKSPLWIFDFPKSMREFYYKENEEREGWLVDMDLIYPEGFGEALSGGEREYEYEKIIKRIREVGSEKDYLYYLSIAKEGLYPSAGFGIGIERLTRYICGLKDIGYTTPFPKIPGKYCI